MRRGSHKSVKTITHTVLRGYVKRSHTNAIRTHEPKRQHIWQGWTDSVLRLKIHHYTEQYNWSIKPKLNFLRITNQCRVNEGHVQKEDDQSVQMCYFSETPHVPCSRYSVASSNVWDRTSDNGVLGRTALRQLLTVKIGLREREH
jgi:hypothetical protein